MDVKITITYAGSNIGNLLDIYTNETGSWVLYIADVPLADLQAGYIFTAPYGADGYQVRDKGLCGTILFLDCSTTTTTSTSSSTSTTTTSTTAVPTTSTTTTSTTAVPTTTTTTTGEPITTTTTTTGEDIPGIYRFRGIDYNSATYNNSADACLDDACDPLTAIGCVDYFSYYNALYVGEVLYDGPSMLNPIIGGAYWFSMSLYIGGVVGPKVVAQINDSGVILDSSFCTSTTTTTLVPTTTTTSTTEPTTTTTTTSP